MIDEAAQTLEASLDALLILMHRSENVDPLVQDYPKHAPGMKGYKTPNRYGSDGFTQDDEGFALQRGERVSFLVSNIEEPWQASLRTEARNLTVGVSVWRNPRLPICPVEREVVRVEARNKLARILQSEGLL